VTGRSFGQVRLMAAVSNLNIRIVGSHAGLLTGEDGATHQALEDISLMRTLPNMTVIQPSDAVEAEEAVLALVKYKGPAYLRLCRGKVPIIHNKNYKFEIGKGELLKQGQEVAIIATGALVHEALTAASELGKHGISARVINIHTIKPIDKSIIIKAAKETGCIVTAEDHNIIGGLGSAVSEVLTDNIPMPLERIGTKDVFGESGKPEELYKKYGLTSNNIIKAAKKVIGRK
jgi:transketolase